MKEFIDWSKSTLYDVRDCGPNALFSFICDYERATRDYGWIPVYEFVKTWTAIRWKDFENLQEGDIVYDYMGEKYQCIEQPYISEDEQYLNIECLKLTNDGMIKVSPTGNNEIFCIGDLYFAPNYTRLAEYRHKILEREERACPILITKTKQPQS